VANPKLARPASVSGTALWSKTRQIPTTSWPGGQNRCAFSPDPVQRSMFGLDDEKPESGKQLLLPIRNCALLSRMAPITRHALRTIGNLDIASPRRLRDRFLHLSERHANCCARPNSGQFDQISSLTSFRLRRVGWNRGGISRLNQLRHLFAESNLDVAVLCRSHQRNQCEKVSAQHNHAGEHRHRPDNGR